jgi:putative ABC transport system ATP-binding protein
MSDAAPVILQLKDIVKTYGTEKNPVRVLKGINVSIRAGEYAAVIGPSGSGKSTLLNILGCLDRPTSGEYYLAGDDVSKMDDAALSRVRNTRIGFVFQSFHLVSHLSVIENVELPLFYRRVMRKERRKRCAELIERVGLSHRIHHLPSELSGGENQRAAVARALANDPAIMLADEPTGNLDSNTTREIMNLFYGLHEIGRTIVVITHDPEIARAAPRRVSLYDGEVESDVVDSEPRRAASA